MLKANDPVLP